MRFVGDTACGRWYRGRYGSLRRFCVTPQLRRITLVVQPDWEWVAYGTRQVVWRARLEIGGRVQSVGVQRVHATAGAAKRDATATLRRLLVKGGN